MARPGAAAVAGTQLKKRKGVEGFHTRERGKSHKNKTSTVVVPRVLNKDAGRDFCWRSDRVRGCAEESLQKVQQGGGFFAAMITRWGVS